MRLIVLLRSACVSLWAAVFASGHVRPTLWWKFWCNVSIPDLPEGDLGECRGDDSASESELRQVSHLVRLDLGYLSVGRNDAREEFLDVVSWALWRLRLQRSAFSRSSCLAR